MTKSLTIEGIKEQISKTPALALYFYNDDCMPCKVLRPKIKELIKEFPQIDLQFINSKENPGVNAGLGIFSNPTILFFFDGKEYIRKSKYVSIDALRVEIARPYQLMFDE